MEVIDMRRGNTSLGGLLIITGGLLLAARLLFRNPLFSLDPGDFWPMIIFLAGAGFELAYYISLRAPGLLVPGGILITYSLLFFFETATNWRFAAVTWPVYLLGVAVGLFQLYLHSGRPRGLLTAISIISGIAAACFIVMCFRFVLGIVDLGVLIPVVLLVGGIIMVSGKKRSAGSGSW